MPASSIALLIADQGKKTEAQSDAHSSANWDFAPKNWMSWLGRSKDIDAKMVQLERETRPKRVSCASSAATSNVVKTREIAHAASCSKRIFVWWCRSRKVHQTTGCSFFDLIQEGNLGTDARRRQVRIPARLKVFNLCHLVDSSGDHPRYF